MKPSQAPQPGQQFLRLEGLDDEIAGAGVEATCWTAARPSAMWTSDFL